MGAPLGLGEDPYLSGRTGGILKTDYRQMGADVYWCMRRSAPCDADPAAPSADPSGARHSRISVGGESDNEQGAAGETEAVAESAVGEMEATRADMVSTLAHDGEVAEVVPTPESSFSSPKPSPKGSSSHGQGRVLPHVLPNPHEATLERAVDELRGGA